MSRNWPKQPVLDLGMLRRRPSPLPSLLDLPHRVFTRSGRSAIVLALQLIGIRPGERVLVPSYHCPTMIAPVERVGAIPVFYPLDSTGMPTLPPTLDTTGVRAMLVAHLFGIPRQLDAVAAYCREKQIVLIEDCAHCFFGEAETVPVGVTGDFAIGSLPKFFPVMEGGILASTSRQLGPLNLRSAPASRELRTAWNLIDLSSQTGRLGALGGAARGVSRSRTAMRRSTESNATPNPTAAKVRQDGLSDPLLGPAQLTRVESWIVAHTDLRQNALTRRANYRALAERLRDTRGAAPLWKDCGDESAPYVMPLLVQDPDDAYRRMRDAGLPVFRWDRTWPGTPVIPGDVSPVWARGIIQIACHQSLLPTNITQIAREVQRCIISADFAASAA